jgi:hypothetical protein
MVHKTDSIGVSGKNTEVGKEGITVDNVFMPLSVVQGSGMSYRFAFPFVQNSFS